ncbi:Uncharacterised protein [Vibrio cholerae]|nr:Uncharacterised protein [Vibrio cholerae]CSI85127.1 Uncharacterised protein [Vibrio cholerae]
MPLPDLCGSPPTRCCNPHPALIHAVSYSLSVRLILQASSKPSPS